MKPYTIREIADACGGLFSGAEELADKCVSSVERDNREVKDGSLFLCFKGEKADGHDFAADAVSRGAVCCIAEKPLDVPHILVGSTLDAVRAIAARYREKFDIPIVGVVGSVGKTTAKNFIYSVLSVKYNTLATIANLNNELGCSLMILMLGEEHEAAVIEMGIDSFGEMSREAEVVRPTHVVMTRIAESHLNNLVDLDGVLRAKSEVFSFMKTGGIAILNGDDPYLRSFDPSVLNSGINKYLFGRAHGCDYVASEEYYFEAASVALTVSYGEATLSATIPAYGTQLVYGALAAVAVGDILKLMPDEIKSGLESYSQVGGRANVLKLTRFTVIDDCYNANRASMNAALDSLSLLQGRKVAILGDMLNLGEKSEEMHREIGERAANVCDTVIFCGELAEDMFKGAIATKLEPDAYYFPLSDAMLSNLRSLIKDGDNVLVKASNAMGFKTVVAELIKIDGELTDI